MDPAALNLLKIVRDLSNSDIAKAAGVSRQAVSLWFLNNKWINIQTNHLLNLSKAFSIRSDDLLFPIEVYQDKKYLNETKAALLWDKLYPSLEEFLFDAIKGKKRAIARFVQVYGMDEASKLFGKSVFMDFHKYKKYINPARRKECEKLWSIIKDQNLN